MKLKSMLVVPAIMLNLGLAIWSLVQVFLTGGDLAWLGAFLACAPFASFVLYIGARSGKVARTGARLPVLQVISAVGPCPWHFRHGCRPHHTAGDCNRRVRDLHVVYLDLLQLWSHEERFTRAIRRFPGA